MTDWHPSPFNKLLGMKILLHSPERTEAELVAREELTNRNSVMHGGAVMALGDTLGGMTAAISLPKGGRTATKPGQLCVISGLADGAAPCATACDAATMVHANAAMIFKEALYITWPAPSEQRESDMLSRRLLPLHTIMKSGVQGAPLFIIYFGSLLRIARNSGGRALR